LVAVRMLTTRFPWAALLCGPSLRLTGELLQKHSPAQGVSATIDADIRLKPATLRAWYESYLTPAAAAGLDDGLIAQLAGRPLFGATFFTVLTANLRGGVRPDDEDPAALVRSCLVSAVAKASAEARTRIDALWNATFETSATASAHRLVVWLYYLQRMGYGTPELAEPASASEAVMTAVQRGILHVGHSDTVINLGEEPLTAAAILAVGDQRTAVSNAPVLRAISQTATGPFRVATASKGAAAEDAIAWTLLRSGLNRTLTLKELLQPLLARDDADVIKPT